MYFARGLLSLNIECQLITLKQIDRGFRIEKDKYKINRIVLLIPERRIEASMIYHIFYRYL